MSNVGYATLSIIPSAKGFGAALNGQVNGAALAAGASGGKAMGKGMTGSFVPMLKGVAGPLAAVFAVSKVKDFVGASIKGASDLGESVNAVNVVFGDAADGVLKLGANAAKSVGLSNVEFNGLAVQFSNFAKTVAGPGGDVTSTLQALTGRAADFASVMNLEVADAATLFQSGLAGETEPLRKYGIDLSAAAAEAYALSKGIVSSKDELTEAAKVQARYGLLMESTAVTQGDFANTSDSLANRQRILGAQWENLKASLGQGLLPVAERFMGVLAGVMEKVGPLAAGLQSSLGPALSGITSAFSSLGGGEGGGALGAVVGFLRDLLPVFQEVGSSILATLGPAFERITATLREHFIPAFLAVLPVLKPIAEFVIRTLGTAIQGVIQGAMTFIDGVLKAISGLFRIFASLVKGDWEGLWNGVKQFVSGIFQALLGAFQVWWNAGILSIFRKGVAALLGSWKGGFDAVKGAATTVLNFVKGLVTRVLQGIVGFFRTGASGMTTVVKGAFDVVKSLFTTGLNAALTTARTVFGNIVGAVRTAIGNAVTAVKELPGQVLGAVKNAGTWLLQAGKDVISGFIRGITSMAGRLVSAIRNTVTDKLPGFVKDALGIASPSKVFADLGRWTGEGFAVGIERSAAKAQAAMSRVVAPPKAPTIRAEATPAGAAAAGSAGLATGLDALLAEVALLRAEVRRQTDRNLQLTRTGAMR